MVLVTRLFVIAFLLGATSFAVAHPAPFSYLDFNLTGDRVRGSVVVHDFDAAHELGIAKPASLLDADVVLTHSGELIRVIGSRLRILADGNAVTPQWGVVDVLPERQSLRLSFFVSQPVHGKLEIEAWLFPYDAKHQSFINIYENGDLKQQAILGAQRKTLTFYTGSLQGHWELVSTFVQAGAHHIAIGFDHMLFLVGLMLLGGTWRRLVAIVTAFTIGHSITLSLAVLDVVHIAPNIIEPAIALSIVVVGVDTLLVNRQQKLTVGTALNLGESRDLRPWFAAIFGLIHGFGFATVLMEVGLPRAARGWSLAAFNVGVEIGQLAIVSAVLVLGVLAKKVLVILPQINRNAVTERFLTIGSLAVVAAGVYWFLQRTGFALGD